jgi:hypothetical protein
VARNAVQFVEENQSAFREIVVIVEAAVKPLESDHVGVVDRLGVGRMRTEVRRRKREKNSADRPSQGRDSRSG